MKWSNTSTKMIYQNVLEIFENLLPKSIHVCVLNHYFLGKIEKKGNTL